MAEAGYAGDDGTNGGAATRIRALREDRLESHTDPSGQDLRAHV